MRGYFWASIRRSGMENFLGGFEVGFGHAFED